MSASAFQKDLDIQIKPKRALIVLAVFLALWFTPCPAGVDPGGWKVMACFVSTIVGFLTGAMPMGAIVLTAITICAVSKAIPVKEALSGFSAGPVWLIAMAFFISRGFTKTGLGLRIAYYFIKWLGKKPLGLSVAVGLTTYVLAPAMPSSTARSGGTIMPLVKSVSEAYGSFPDKDRRRIGAYLMLSAFNVNYPVGAAYMTAMAGNALAAGMAGSLGVEMTWFSWWWYMLVPAFVGVVLTPIVLYYIYPPELKESPMAREMAIEKLKEMGPLTKPQKVMMTAFILLLVLWVFGAHLKLNATMAAFVGILFLNYMGVLTWKDILSERGAYDCLFWFAGLIMMAGCLNKYGVIKWATSGIGAAVAGLNWPLVLLAVVLCGMYFAYCFASSTAFIGALYTALLAIGINTGVPPVLCAVALAAVCNLHACLTFYSGGSGPVFFSQGYVSANEWLRCGFLLSVFHLISWAIFGGIWWKVLGLY
ncbi:MAG: DASS family sodium-coupled anion symporter [Desulfovibrio sp.]|nr:DASS family sodium-coupled anion symporter [Desulfovibrio sp.]